MECAPQILTDERYQRMKIYTVTYLNQNYGSVLQAFALQRKFADLGVESVILQQKKTDSIRNSTIYRYLRLLKPKKNYSLYQRIKLERQKSVYSEKGKKLDAFIRDRLCVEWIQKPEDIYPTLSEEDILLAGSDQIWSMISGEIPDWYALQWKSLPKGVRRFSYAASIGLCNLTESQKESYRKKIQGFECISLREEQAVAELKPYLGDTIRCDVDPTLLFDGVFWENVSSERIVERPYIFVYMLRPDTRIIEMARKLASEKKCEVIYTGLMADQFEGVQTVCNAGVEDFLSYIRHAEYILTNSFHGTVFSVLFKKQFLSVKIASTSSRVENLLTKVGLTDRLIVNLEEISKIDLPINYTPVHNALAQERIRSEQYLKQIIKGGK